MVYLLFMPREIESPKCPAILTYIDPDRASLVSVPCNTIFKRHCGKDFLNKNTGPTAVTSNFCAANVVRGDDPYPEADQQLRSAAQSTPSFTQRLNELASAQGKLNEMKNAN